MHCSDDELESTNSEDDNSTTEEANVKGARVCLKLCLNNLKKILADFFPTFCI